ncbi:flagellar basal body-associated protein FliL [Clostridium sp.]|uniref:flagellar basal body-associated FliL family protein n=1 Tax=Clostridium sp. TaxID=1506 RepID=UPI001A3DABD2|nr:flagellar basal body-associated FliL family protein [Clostridium sp.]MBK5240413.1 flagellar basal body-associated FliL family protein [Clostridium sp.]
MSDKPKNGNAFKIVIIVLLVLVVLGGATFGTMYFLKKDSGAAAEPKVIVEQTYPLGEFTINLLDDSGKRFIKVNIYIGYETNEKLTTELEEKNEPIIRDAVNTYIRAKHATDFSVTGLDVIKKELIKSINLNLTKGIIINIYFNDILIQ